MLEINESEIVKRRSRLEAVLNQICRNSKANVQIINGNDCVELVLTQGQTRAASLLRYPSRKESIYLNFVERWSLVSAEKYNLIQSYLHIYEYNKIKDCEEEVIAYHCDPYISGAENNIYMKLPHMHFKDLRRDLSKAHISVCLIGQATVYKSPSDYSNELARVVRLINVELMSRLG
ncbi:hypothetical protein HXX25_01870 [Hyphobacterium sp. CCMP332]|uniref:hypothetical protein n=1 Tax=Hyphobacterium sp. CCMP332 TaxID=2749086 RepID=UPI0016509674|nr:hypothetical protein [Hyphobacterium sp. CCMP332]QNL18191.1 hypothetical protein HXX25_01870 [Hyphobacterium sp. CCMP332]